MSMVTHFTDHKSRDSPVSAHIDIARLRLQLRDRSLEQLETEGLVEWDESNDVVRKGPKFEDKHPPLRY